MKRVDIYTDGACSGNPGAGGWAAILIYNGVEKEISGYNRETTNNRMELFAVIQGLKQLNQQCDVTVYSDSAYVCNAFLEGWIDDWIAADWKLKGGKGQVKNADLWKMLLLECGRHKVKFVKVKGHADNVHNNRCDKLATGEIAKASKNIDTL